MIPSILTIILSLLPLASGTSPANCTVERLQKDVKVSLKDFNKVTLEENQAYFREKCSDQCWNVEVNGILRTQCSKPSNGYAVYQCPDDSLFYLMNPTNCYIKYYTLCSRTASHQDHDLTDTIKDLICSCSSEFLKHYVNGTDCTVQFDKQAYLYCKDNGNSHIKFVEACGFGVCEDKIDVDKDRGFNCGEKGMYCQRNENDGYIRNVFKCDGTAQCDDSEDEKDCDETSGVYCDEDGEKIDYKQAKDVCDGFAECADESDESEEKCPDNYCKAGNGSSIYMTENILCDGKADCGDAKDEQQANCERLARFFYPGDGAPCDNNTKWIRSKNLCSGKCEDGMDREERWNCDQHEQCPESEDSDTPTILCNSTIICTPKTLGLSQIMHENCQYCADGAANSVKRCKDTGKGIVCSKVETGPFDVPEDIFVPNAELCDGNFQCQGKEDEEDCSSGYYCTSMRSNEKIFIPWRKVCPGAVNTNTIKDALCKDQSDKLHCESDFFDVLTFKDGTKGNEEVNYADYLNVELIFGETADKVDKDSLLRVVKHRAFACQEYYYNLNGPKGDIIKETIEELCIDEDDFKCPRPYETKFPNNGTLNQKIMKNWMCQYSDYCKFEGTKKPQIELCRNSSYCYTDDMRCNNKNDCTEFKIDNDDNKYIEIADKTDEIGCSNKGLKCGPGKSVIEDAYVCDGFYDCETEVDEKICDGNYKKTEDAVDESCDVNRTEEYHLYSKYTLNISDPRESYSLTQIKVKVVKSCDCSQLTGTRYMAAVCNTQPNGTDQPCSDSSVYNNTLCYPELMAQWYTQDYNTKVEEDVSCKTQTKTLTSITGEGGVVTYRTFVRYHNDSSEFIDKSVFCKNNKTRKEKKCGIPLTTMCDLVNDCGDWSDESSTYCRNNFECKIGQTGNVTRVIANSKKCNGASDCDRSQDECLDECNEDGITNTVSLLGGVGLLVVVWIMGVVSLIFNFYLIIAMTKSAFDVLEKVPHRFIYRILVTTIAIGDVMVSVYLVMLASVDSFRDRKYCEMKEQWLTGSACMAMGVLSTFGNHVSLFAMVTLSMFRLKTVVNYLWPRSVNKAKAIRITIVLVLGILIVAALISTIPLVDSLKDSFVDRYYFPKRGNVFERGEKRHIYHTLNTYNDVGQFNDSGIKQLTEDSSWDALLNGTDVLFNGSVIITGKKPYSFYSAYGVCLFNYLNSTGNNSFPYVISIIALNLVCFLTIIASYLWIWKVGTTSKSTERQLQKKLSIAVFLNILCRLPLFMICLAHSIEQFDVSVSEKCTGTCLYYRYMSVFVIPINSVINPFINSEAGILDLLRAKCLAKRQNMITTNKTITNSVTVGTSLTTVSTAGNRNPTYQLSKVNPPSTLEEETTN
ncbi:uncharacterized protein LOC134817742 isoform X2 [Bolinopsis microptera]|uniref:uncharacterized protein LOC134817742 isoform X2 n=1 Tax=Bolinopsis microptera TaxID=2820187 RepID=UPI00307A9C19